MSAKKLLYSCVKCFLAGAMYSQSLVPTSMLAVRKLSENAVSLIRRTSLLAMSLEVKFYWHNRFKDLNLKIIFLEF